MLAYVVWHRGGGEVEQHTYEANIAAFHSALAELQPEHFLASMVFSVESLPWMPATPLYEEWYLMSGSEGLDALDEAVKSEALVGPHGRLSANTVALAAALMSPRGGETDPLDPSLGIWLHKPADMSYEDFDAAMALALASDGSGLWQRKMGLGSSPEFCLLANEQPFGPSDIVEAVTKRELLFRPH